jgi:flagellar hook-associated protein 1 FlgK
MSRIWGMMDMGKRSMQNSQTALQTTAHNVASKNVEGYTRQRVEMETVEPTGMGKLRVGNGARSTAVKRINNSYIEKQLEHEGNSLGNKDAQAQMMSRVETVFNEQSNKGFNKAMSDFFNAFREMSNSPENIALRNMVKEAGDNLARDFKRISTQLNKVQGEADFQIANEVAEINSITKEIAGLNEKVAMVEMNGASANDERDRRDLLLKKLSEHVDIRWGESKDGVVSVTAGNTALLVSGTEQRDLVATASAEHGDKRSGNFDIFYKSVDSGTATPITEQLKGGSLGGLLQVRDKFINEVHDNIDDLAYTFGTEVNRAHQSGYDRYSAAGGNFFEVSEKRGAAQNIKLNDRILEDPGRIAAGAQPNAPGDNRVANVISSLAYQQKMANGQSTFNDFYGNIVGRVGVVANRANSEFESQKDTVAQLKNIRESISGVSLDEETTKMIEYQKSYEASARLIKAADEMIDTVLNLKRM